jgi:hypothetical protein
MSAAPIIARVIESPPAIAGAERPMATDPDRTRVSGLSPRIGTDRPRPAEEPATIVNPLGAAFAHAARNLPVCPCIPDGPERKSGSRSGHAAWQVQWRP